MASRKGCPGRIREIDFVFARWRFGWDILKYSIFSLFLLVLIGIELTETIKVYLLNDSIRAQNLL